MRRILAEVTDCPIPLLAQLLRSSQMCEFRMRHNEVGSGCTPRQHDIGPDVHSAPLKVLMFPSVQASPGGSALRRVGRA